MTKSIPVLLCHSFATNVTVLSTRDLGQRHSSAYQEVAMENGALQTALYKAKLSRLLQRATLENVLISVADAFANILAGQGGQRKGKKCACIQGKKENHACHQIRVHT